MIIYKNTKVKVCSPDGDTDYFNIVVGVLQQDTLAPYLIIICQYYILQKSIDLMRENCLTLAKARSRRYLARTITDTDYADDITLLANTPALAESLRQSLERAADGIGLHVNADKTKHVRFNQSSDISTQRGGSLKLVNKFNYPGNNISSTRLEKAWTAIDRLSVIWKSNLSYKIKHIFSKQRSSPYYCMDPDKAYGEKARQQLHKDAVICTEQVM